MAKPPALLQEVPPKIDLIKPLEGGIGPFSTPGVPVSDPQRVDQGQFGSAAPITGCQMHATGTLACPKHGSLDRDRYHGSPHYPRPTAIRQQFWHWPESLD